MKKQFYVWVIAIALVASTNQAWSQEPVKTMPPITITASSRVNQKVSSSFERYFKGAVNPRWYKLDKDYLVQFIKDDMNNHALFTKRGSLIYHISYGTEQNLPEDIRKMVRTSYLDYNITRAVNVKEGDRDIWVCNLESPTKLILVRVENGELEEVGNYVKSL